MNITIVNFKGGVGKSMIAHQLISGYGFNGYEIDPYGSLSDRLPECVMRIDIQEKKSKSPKRRRFLILADSMMSNSIRQSVIPI